MSNQETYIISLKDLFTQSLRNASSELDKLENKVNKTNSTLSTFAKAAAGYFTISAIKDFALGVVEVGSQFEKAEIGLSTLLKSTEKAREVFANIKEDAATTPFDVQSLLKANSLLISAGVDAENARKDVLNLGNAIAATGGGSEELQRMAVNLQGIKNIGTATARDIKEFAYANINIYGLLADATGRTKEEVKDMDFSYDQLSYALARANAEGGKYAGGLEKLSKSTSVQVSNLGDAVMFLKDDLFKALKPAIDSVISGFSSFVSIMRSGVAWMQENSKVVKTAAVFMGAFVAGILAYNTYVAIARTATMAWAAAQAILNGTMALNPIGFIITAVAALTAGIYYLWENCETFRFSLFGIWEVAKSLFDIFVKIGKVILFPSPENIKDAFSAVKNMDLAGSFNKGFAGRKKDELSKNGTGTMADAMATNGPGGAGLIPGMSGAGSAVKPESVGSVRPTTVNVTIGKFQDSININTTNLKESASAIAEQVNKYLLSVVNDVNRMAGA